MQNVNYSKTMKLGTTYMNGFKYKYCVIYAVDKLYSIHKQWIIFFYCLFNYALCVAQFVYYHVVSPLMDVWINNGCWRQRFLA